MSYVFLVLLCGVLFIRWLELTLEPTGKDALSLGAQILQLQSTCTCDFARIWLYRLPFIRLLWQNTASALNMMTLGSDAAGLASTLCRKQSKQSQWHNPQCDPVHAHQPLNLCKPPFGSPLQCAITCHLSAQQWPQCGTQRCRRSHSCGQCAAEAINCLVELATAATAASLL